MSTIDASKMDKYVDGQLVKEGKKDTNEPQRFNWWKAEGDELARQISGTIRFIQTHQSTRLERLTVATRLYGNSQAFSFIGPALSRSASSSANSSSNRISFNLCSSVVDTLTAKVAKNKIIPTFITSGGVWGMQKKAEDLSKFTEGVFYDQDIHSKGVYAFRDAGVWGTGVLHVFDSNGQVAVERVLPHELLVDELEALVGEPRQIHRVKLVDRDVLLSMFQSESDEDKEARENIGLANPASYIETGAMGSAADLIPVTESWHLRSNEDSEDGLHVLCIEGKVLHKEDYKKDYFPFAFIHYCKRLTGFWGQGACDRLQNIQGEINRSMILEQRSRWMQGSFKILVENGSKVVSQHLNNEVGSIIHYQGTPPQYVTPPAINGDNQAYIDQLIAKGYQQEGVSQLSASSLKPMGVDSGAALRTFDQIADDRFLFTMQEVEQFYLEIARQCIEVVKDIAKHSSYDVLFPGTNFVESIDWKDIKLKEDEYVLKAFPTSSLPDDPAGKLATIQEYMQAGLVSPRAGRRLLAMPDVEMSDKLANAAENLLCKVMEDMLEEDGKYRAPEPFWDLTLGRQIALEYYNYADLNNCPEDRLEIIRRWLNQLGDLTGANQPTPQPMANPTAAPTSNLIPNVPGGSNV